MLIGTGTENKMCMPLFLGAYIDKTTKHILITRSYWQVIASASHPRERKVFSCLPSSASVTERSLRPEVYVALKARETFSWDNTYSPLQVCDAIWPPLGGEPPEMGTCRKGQWTLRTIRLMTHEVISQGESILQGMTHAVIKGLQSGSML